MTPGRTSLFALAACALALALAGGSSAGAQAPAPAPAPAPAAGQEGERTGEQIMNASCASACHDYWTIQTSAKTEEEWVTTIDRMFARGATLTEEEYPVLLEYLVRFHGPIPDGPGKQIVLEVCTQCHDLTRIKRTGHTPEEWQEILITMLNEGAPLSDADFPVVLLYLARNFGVP
jgi:hypothetical protein